MATITSPRSASPAVAGVISPSLPSGANTPTSSVRHSIELPSSSNVPASQNAAPNPNQRRNRAALRDYYNLKSKPNAVAASPAASSHNLSRTASVTSTTSTSSNLTSATLTTDTGHGTSLPATLDDPNFDAETYIQELLKTSSLKDILRTESTLVSEIRNLDGERKALVYDNYSKLIVAVGTIGEMQKGIVDQGGPRANSGLTRMKGLEDKLEGLMAGFRDVNGGQRGNGEVNTAHRTDIEERRKARAERRNKELVRWVLDAPERFESMVEEGKREEAEKEWEHVQRLLEKWRGVEGVEHVQVACKKVLESDDNEGD